MTKTKSIEGISLRGRTFTGTVVSSKMTKTAVVEFSRQYFLKKYERFERRRTKLKVHNPEAINAKEGDIVKIMESRPLSKTKHFVIVENFGPEKGFKGKMEARQEGKVDHKKPEAKTETKEAE